MGYQVSINKLRVEHFSKQFKEVPALRDVSFEVADWIYGLIGPNGAGKSNLIHIIVTLLIQTSRFIYYNDQNIKILKHSYRTLIGLMPLNQSGYDETIF